MSKWARTGIGASVRGGAVLLAYAVLSPAIWSRSVFDGFAIATALAIGGGMRVDRLAEPVRVWLQSLVLTSVGFAATLVVIAVGLEAALGEESVLTSTQQQIAFGTAAVIAVGFWVWLGRATRVTAFTDPDGETRRNAIRANIRKEIDEIERAAAGATDPTKPSEG